MNADLVALVEWAERSRRGTLTGMVIEACGPEPLPEKLEWLRARGWTHDSTQDALRFYVRPGSVEGCAVYLKHAEHAKQQAIADGARKRRLRLAVAAMDDARSRGASLWSALWFRVRQLVMHLRIRLPGYWRREERRMEQLARESVRTREGA